MISKLLQTFLKGMTHPIGIFILLQIVWVAVLILWVVLFLSQKEAAFELAKTLGEKKIDPTYGLILLTIGCVLLGIILLGTVMLFIFTQKQASFLNQQRSFVSSITHELRSPLASLQLSFETLQKPSLPDNVKKKIYLMVDRDITRLLDLIERILISSRLDRGIFELDQNKEPIKLSKFIASIVNQAKHLDPDAEQRVRISCPPDLTIGISRLGLSLILGNLIENALKYSPNSSPIYIEAAVESQSRLILSVQDFGLGLDAKDQRKIFRMFYRTAHANKKAIKGTGLGLFIVKSTAKLLGGSIWAESEGPAKGSTFYASLPLDEATGRKS